MLDNVCRLCLGTQNLLWIFDEKMADNMPEIIEVTSGVQIAKSDTITQMVCSTCCQITIKMFKFRTTSIKNDKDLKAKCAGYNVSQLTNVNLETKKELSSSNKSRVPHKYKFAHPSIKDIIKKYPNIKLPEMSLKSHFGPYITLLTDEVDDWYKDKNISDKDIEMMKKKASEYAASVPENCSSGRGRRKRRKFSFDSKIWSTSRRSSSSSDKLAPNQPLNKRVKVNDEESVKTTKPVNNVVTRSNANVDSKPADNTKENTTQTDVGAKVQSTSKLDKNDNKDVKNTKTTSNLVKMKINSKNSVKSTDTVIKLKTKSNVEQTVLPTLGSVLQSMLNRENIPKKNDSEITLKSILAEVNGSEEARSSDTVAVASENSKEQTVNDDSVQKSHNKDSDVIEIDDSENDKVQQNSMFTTTPFVRNAEKFRENKSINNARTENSVVAELLVLSDSDEDTRKNKKTSLNSNDDAPTQNVENPNATKLSKSTNENSIRGNKSDFIRSLELAPKETANMPDLSLLSVTEKTNTLYICKVCDSHYNSLKELKIHTRRIHTKCPFCSKRFRNLANRDEHIKYNCVANNSRFQLKKPKLSLVRINEVEEIRKKYPNAFKALENEENVTEQEAVENDNLRTTGTALSLQAELSPAVSLISTPSSSTTSLPIIPTPSPPPTMPQPQPPQISSLVPPPVVLVPAPAPSTSNTPPQQPTSSKESSSSQPQTSDKQPNNSDTSGKYDAETADAVRELEKFLESSPVASSSQKKLDAPSADLSSNTEEATASGADVASDNTDIICISDDEEESISESNEGGSNRKVKIINNPMLRNINLHDNDMNILKRILGDALQRKGADEARVNGMKDNTIINGGTSKIKVFKNLRKHLQHYKIPIEISYSPVLNVEYRSAKIPSQKRIKDIWTDMIPQDLKFISTIQTGVTSTLSARKNVPNVMSNANASCRSTSVIVPSQPSNNASRNIITNVFQPNLSGMEQQRNVPHISQFQNTLETVPSSHSLILTSHNTLVSSPQVSHTFAPNTPVLLNSTQNIYTTPTSTYQNFIIVPTSMVATSQNTSLTTLPSTQGPLPVIQSVATAQELATTSFNSNCTQSAPVPSTSSTQPAVQPSIRVRHLSELS